MTIEPKLNMIMQLQLDNCLDVVCFLKRSIPVKKLYFENKGALKIHSMKDMVNNNLGGHFAGSVPNKPLNDY